LCILFAGGCASGPIGAARAGPSPHDLASLPGRPGCFWLRAFDGSWTALNQRQLLVYAPLTSPPYLVQLFQPIPTLQFTERLGFEATAHSGQICNNTQDYLLVPNWQPHRIPITAVHQVTPEQARELLHANGLKAPRQKERG